MHQDINPGNIARGRDGVVRLLDFGTVANLTPALNTVGKSTVQATTAVGWHPGFAAPETLMLKSRKASDQYALCKVAMAAIAGRPGGGVTTREISAAVSASVAEVLTKASHSSPRGRFPSCTAFVTALRQAMSPLSPNRPSAATSPKQVVRSPHTKASPKQAKRAPSPRRS